MYTHPVVDADHQIGYLVHPDLAHQKKLQHAHATREAVKADQAAAHTDLSAKEAKAEAEAFLKKEGVIYNVDGSQDHGSHYYPGRGYADEKAMIEHDLMMSAAHPLMHDAGHHDISAHSGYGFGAVSPHEDYGRHLDDHYYRDASVQDHLARAMDFKPALQ